MVDLDYLAKLLSILKDNGLSSFKTGEVSLVFHVEQSKQSQANANQAQVNTQDHMIDVPINEADLPPDLRTDHINSYDTIMNWSTTPQDEIPLPGTGEDEQ